MKQVLLDCQQWLMTKSEPPKTHNSFFNKINKYKLLPRKSKVITVAGTNGKGSTVACLEAILLAEGYKVACFTSPHLITINERCRFNGFNCDVATFLAAFNTVQQWTGVEKVHWFTFLFLVFLLLCSHADYDYILIETGVGGRHCVSNCIDSDIAVVTTVDLDHVALLGNTREEIGYQKAGIFRASKPAICGDPNPPQSLIDYALEINSNLLIQNKDFFYSLQEDSWFWQQTSFDYQALPLPPVIVQNASTALAALQYCNVGEDAIVSGLQQVEIKGRWHILQTAPVVICDVAHNPQACRYLAGQLAKPFTGKTYAITTMKAGKDIESSLLPLLPWVEQWLLVSLPGEDIFIDKASEILIVQQATYQVCDTATLALKKAQAISSEDDRILIFGSFQLVGDIIHTYENSKS